MSDKERVDAYYENFLQKIKALAAKKGVALPADDGLIVMNNDGLTPARM